MKNSDPFYDTSIAKLHYLYQLMVHKKIKKVEAAD